MNTLTNPLTKSKNNLFVNCVKNLITQPKFAEVSRKFTAFLESEKTPDLIVKLVANWATQVEIVTKTRYVNYATDQVILRTIVIARQIKDANSATETDILLKNVEVIITLKKPLVIKPGINQNQNVKTPWPLAINNAIIAKKWVIPLMNVENALITILGSRESTLASPLPGRL